MTTPATYQALITSEHSDKPKYMALVGMLAGCYSDLNNFLLSLPNAFDIDNATGQRQDVLGAWVGLSRNLQATAPGIYTQAPMGATPLTDNDYKILLHGKVFANSWDGTLQGAYDKLRNILGAGSGSTLFMIDHQDMSIDIAIAGTVPSAGQRAAIAGGYMQIRPAAVLANYFFPSAPGGPLFGFDTQNSLISGFDTGVWATPI